MTHNGETIVQSVDVADQVVYALECASAILRYCPQMSTNLNGHGPWTTTRGALSAVNGALLAVNAEVPGAEVER